MSELQIGGVPPFLQAPPTTAPSGGELVSCAVEAAVQDLVAGDALRVPVGAVIVGDVELSAACDGQRRQVDSAGCGGSCAGGSACAQRDSPRADAQA